MNWGREVKGEGMQERRPSSSSSLCLMKHRADKPVIDRKRPTNPLTVSLRDRTDSLWAAMGNRSIKKVALLLVSEPLQRTSYLCEECSDCSRRVFWVGMRCVYLIVGVTARLKFREQWRTSLWGSWLYLFNSTYWLCLNVVRCRLGREVWNLLCELTVIQVNSRLLNSETFSMYTTL